MTGGSVHDAPLAVVTGASSGIGAEFTRVLRDRGYRVLAVARRADRLDELAKGSNGFIVPFVRDVTSEGAAEAILGRAEELGGADLVVCNAGRGSRGRIHESDPADALGMIRLNVTANVSLVTQAVPKMVARGSGGIIVVASNLGFFSTPNMGVYGATKAFLLSFTESLSAELAGTGVRAMALCPGATSTEFGDVAGLGDTVEKTPGFTTPEEVVRGGLKAWDKGRTITVPGTVARLLTAFLAYSPRALSRRIMGKIFTAG